MDNAIDHLVFATSDLQQGVDRIETLFGLSTYPGGSHPGMGTRNAILALGPKCYLEIIGPDPDQTDFQGTRIFGIDTIEQGKLVHWCVRRDGLRTFAQQVKSRGIELSATIPMSRVTTLGNRLDWELVFPTSFDEDCAIPFFIDWGSSPHPASECREKGELKEFQIRHPDPEKINGTLQALSIDACAVEDSESRLYALIKCRRGEVELY
jgi:hypothetical protein